MTDHLEFVQPVADAPYPTGAHFDRDPRNADHPLSLALPSSRAFLPQARPQPWSRAAPIFDQGAENSCVAQAIAGIAVTAPWVVGMSATQIALATTAGTRQQIDGRLWLYTTAQTEDGITVPHEGTTPTAGFKAARTLDLQPERDDTEPGHVGEWGYAWAGHIDEVAAYLSQIGPMALATRWLSGMWEPDANGFIHSTGPVEAAHEVYFDWFDATERRFRIANSWGDQWGPLHGYAFLSYGDAADRLDDGGQASGWYRR